MNAATIERIQSNVEVAAAAMFAAAAAFAAFAGLGSILPSLQAGLCASGAALFAFVLCKNAMAIVRRGDAELRLSIFDVRELEPFESNELLLTDADRYTDELVLTDADRLPVQNSAEQEALLLEDALPGPASDARVVRLFDRKAMPTPGQLRSRIDDHLNQASPTSGQSDASQALAAALAELRRSLR
jgi:hypothetical protein